MRLGKVYSYFINDSEPMARQGEPKRKRFPLTGRLYINFGHRKSICFSYSIWSKFCFIGFDHNEDLTFKVGVPPVSLWLSFAGFIPMAGYEKEREIEFSIHGGSLWWNIWTSNMSWSSKTPKWRRGSFHFVDFLLGRSVYSELTLEEQNVVVPMPEGTYEGKARLFESTWKRPRWFIPMRVKRVDINLPKGIPYPGKGENSWDCGDDATFGLTCSATSIPDGVGQLVGSCLKNRVRYGGYQTWTWPRGAQSENPS